MRITVQNKSVESTPIVIDLQDGNAQSTEAFGLSNIFSLKGENVKEIFDRSEVKQALKRAKSWISSKGYSPITPAECKKLDKTLFAQIFRRGGRNKDGKNDLDIHKGMHYASIGMTAYNAAKTTATAAAYGAKNALASGLGVIAGSALGIADSAYALVKSQLNYFQVDGVTIQSTPILRSFAESISGIGNLNILGRAITNKKLRLLYICYKTSDNRVGIKPLCKVIVKDDSTTAFSKSKSKESLIDTIFNECVL